MPHRQRTLVTGFLGFGRFAENPSAALARGSGRPFHTIEVRYDAVDRFLGSLDPDRFDRLLLIGVAGGSPAFRLERLARNRHGPTPDVAGYVPPLGPIDADHLPTRPSTLWCDATCAACIGEDVVLSDDAGDYLCNYLLHRALLRFPDRRIGFLHVPPADVMPLDRQARRLEAILAAIEPPPAVLAGSRPFPR